jgi:hypothetical protein
MKWSAELMYVRRDSHGVIVGIRELKPSAYEPEQENANYEPPSSSSDVPSKTGLRVDASVSSLEIAFPKQRKAVGE